MATKNPTPSTEVAVAKPQGGAVAAPMDWKAHMKSVAVKVAEAEKPTGSYISFKGGRLNIGDTTAPGDRIECIVIHSLHHNKYFSTDYDAKKVVPPDCYAFATEEPDLKPSEKAEDPQGGDEGFCAGCPMNEWGSSPKGGRGKACSNSRRVWVLPADVLNDPSKVARVDPLQFDLPVTSVRNFSKFVNDVVPMGVPPFAVVCEVSVKPHDTTLFQVHFKTLERIKDEAALEQLAMRNWKLSQEPFPEYPTREELEERANGTPAGGGSKKY